jgi:hypothetical protein
MAKMCWRIGAIGAIGAMAAASLLAGSAAAVAHGTGPDFLLSCDNGRTYPIRARAVTVDGDLVTGYIYTGRHRGTHFRLVPMGDGYRYVARGLYFEGWRADAELDFRKHHPIACTVAHG